MIEQRRSLHQLEKKKKNPTKTVEYKLDEKSKE